jgi:hypothetical protein
MAAYLVQHSDVTHTFIHNLKLAFWVLLWLAFLCMSNLWSTKDCSSFLNETMSPQVSCASGGLSKIFFMQAEHLLSDFSVNNNSILTCLLKKLKKTLTVQYQWCLSNLSSEVDSIDSLVTEAETKGDVTLETGNHDMALLDKRILDKKQKAYKRSWNHLQSHKAIITIIKKALNSSRWPKDDAADPQYFLRCNEVLASM